MRIGLVQYNAAFEDKGRSKERLTTLIRRLPKGKPLDWLIFPEMTLSSFSQNPAKTTLSPDDIAFFAAIARERRAFVSFGGVRGGRNDIVTLDRAGREASSYSKIHLFSLLDEHRRYKAGRESTTFSLAGARVSPAICFDLRFAYLFWRLAEKTDVFVVIACWPAHRAASWACLLKARAIENLCWVVGVNRTGRDPGFEYCGLSAVYDPMGVPVLECGHGEGVFTAEIDPKAVRQARAKLKFLEDRKPRAAWA